MGEKIAYLGFDKRLSTEVILRALSAARESLGEETPRDFYAWVQRADAARRVRWCGLLARMECELFPPSANLASELGEVVDHMVLIRRYSVVGTRQFELFRREPGRSGLTRQLSIVSEAEEIGVAAGRLAVPPRAGDCPILLGLAQSFPGEEEAYWDAYDRAEVYCLAREGVACAPTLVDESAMHGTRNFLPYSNDEDDMEAAFADADDDPPPDSGSQARGASGGIPTTWPELLQRVSARIPRMEVQLSELAPPQGDAWALIEPTNAIVQRALAESPETCVAWMHQVGPHFMPALQKVKQGFGAADAIGFVEHLIVVRAMGVQVGPEIEAFARQMVELVARDASSLKDQGRKLLAICALGLGAFDAVGRLLGEPLPDRVQPRETHSFGHEQMLRYLAAGLRAKQPAHELLPAFREVVSQFPYSLHTEKLDWADLVAIARAFYVHALGRSSGEVMKLLHAEVRGRGLTPQVVSLVRDEGPREPPNEQGTAWADLVGRVRNERAANETWLEAAMGWLSRTSQPDARWLLLGMIAEVANKLTACLGPEASAPIFARIDPMLLDWVGELRNPQTGQGTRVAAGLAYFDAARLSGASLLPVAAAAERFLYPQLTELAREPSNAQRVALAFGALSMGALPLVEGFLAPRLLPTPPWEPAATLALALVGGGDAFVAWTRLLGAFPAARDGRNVSWSLLLAAARSFLCRVEARPTDSVGRCLHRIVTGQRPAHRPWDLPTRSEEFGLVYNRGDIMLSLDGARALRLVQQEKEWEAMLSAVAAPNLYPMLMQALRVARFPAVPAHGPGQNNRVLCANGASGEAVARMESHAARSFAGYAEIFAILDTLVVQASSGELAVGPNTLPPSVESCRRVR